MAKLKQSMFREYDLRGRVNDEELNEYSIGIIAKSYGTMLRQKGIDVAVIGHDYRQESEWVTETTIQGLVSTGINVINLGMILTPMMYFAQYHYSAQGGVMVTASHNPKGWSGFKFALDYSKTLGPQEIDELYTLTKSEQFETGSGTVDRPDSEGFLNAYIADLRKRVQITPPIRVVVNAGNGTPGKFVPRILREVGCEVEELYCKLDSNFPHYYPNPALVEMMEDTGKRVVDSKADIGFAIDGDGDRLGVTDERGRIVWPDRYLILLARQVLESNPGAKIIFDVKCSQALPEDIKDHGGEPIMWKTGHSYIKQKLWDEKAPLAGEMSGHIFFGNPEYYGFDDAVFAALKLVEYLSHRKRPILRRLWRLALKLVEYLSYQAMSYIVAQTPDYVSTPALQVKCPADETKYKEAVKYKVVDQLTKEFKEERLLFNVDLEFASDLDAGRVTDRLRQEFRDHQLSLSQTSGIITQEIGERWQIVDGSKEYLIVKEDQALNIYEDVNDINGVRVNFGDGWGLVRASSNLPVLVLRFEARTEQRKEEIIEIFKEKFAKYPEIGSKWESG
jgi:phosphomannomutase/phosphoglucomutase